MSIDHRGKWCSDLDSARFPPELNKGISQSLLGLLHQEGLPLVSPRAGLLALYIFDSLIQRWLPFKSVDTQLALLGINNTELEAYWRTPEAPLPLGTIYRLDLLSRIFLSLRILSHDDVQYECRWLQKTKCGGPDWMLLPDIRSPLVFMCADIGIDNMKTICGYLEDKARRVQSNDRYLLCLGVCNTLIEVPTLHPDMALQMMLNGMENPYSELQKGITNARKIPSAISLENNDVLLPRPYLLELIDFIKGHQALDVAIISGASHDYIERHVGRVAPDLLEMCQFIWAMEDCELFQRRVAGDTFKTIERVPELAGYKPGRILMVDNNRILPTALWIQVSPFMVGGGVNLDYLEEDKALLDVIRRVSILTQVDDVIALRKQEEEEAISYSKQESAYAIEQKTSLFSPDYREKMKDFPLARPSPIDF